MRGARPSAARAAGLAQARFAMADAALPCADGDAFCSSAS